MALARMLSACLMIAGASPVWATCDEGEEVIRFTHVVSAVGHPKGEAATALADEVNRILDGRACMIVHPNAELFNDDQAMFEALLSGDVQIAVPTFSKLGGVSRRFRVFDLPFLFEDLEHVIDYTYLPEVEELLEAGTDQGYRGLAYWMTGMSQMTAIRPLLTPQDADGLAFRIQGSPVEVAVFDALGASTDTIAFRDVLPSLQSGRVTAQANTWSNIWLKEFYTAQDGVTVTNHGLVASMLITSDEWWQGLAPDVQADLSFAIQMTTHERNRFAYQLNEVAQNNLRQAGVPIRTLPDDDRAAWVAQLAPVWDQFRGEIGGDLIAAAQR